MNMTPETYTHSHATHSPLQKSPCAKSERHSYVPCDQTQPRPIERDQTCSNYFIVIKNEMWILLSTKFSKKTVISKLIALALLAVHLPQIRTFTELQTPDNQDSRQQNSLDILNKTFVKITLLSNSHSESFYLF
jgi:hypothetical protein